MWKNRDLNENYLINYIPVFHPLKYNIVLLTIQALNNTKKIKIWHQVLSTKSRDHKNGVQIYSRWHVTAGDFGIPWLSGEWSEWDIDDLSCAS